jgi:hypothetical protein
MKIVKGKIIFSKKEKEVIKKVTNEAKSLPQNLNQYCLNAEKILKALK